MEDYCHDMSVGHHTTALNPRVVKILSHTHKKRLLFTFRIKRAEGGVEPRVSNSAVLSKWPQLSSVLVAQDGGAH